MSNASIVIEGYLSSDPKVGSTQSGDNYAGFSVAHTPRRKNRDTNEWEDAGDTLWVNVTLWREDADRFAAHLVKGVQVRVEGEPILRDWESNGKSGKNLEIKFPKVSIIPAKGAQQSHAPVSQPADTWATPSIPTEEVPF